MSAASRSLRLSTGVTLDYVEQGPPANVPVIFLHGFADSWHSFDPVLAELRPEIHAVAPSFRGHGESSKPARGYGISDLAADIEALLEALALPPAILVGHSLGSAVAIRFAIDRPDRTRGVVLVGATPTISASAAARAFWDELLARLTDPVEPGLIRAMTEGMVARPVAASLIDDMVAESSKVPPHVWRELFESRWRGEGEYATELASVTAPALIVWGDRDPRYGRADQQTLATKIPNARLLTYEGAGHAVHWEEPARFAADVARFVGVIAEPPTSSHGAVV